VPRWELRFLAPTRDHRPSRGRHEIVDQEIAGYRFGGAFDSFGIGLKFWPPLCSGCAEFHEIGTARSLAQFSDPGFLFFWDRDPSGYGLATCLRPFFATMDAEIQARFDQLEASMDAKLDRLATMLVRQFEVLFVRIDGIESRIAGLENRMASLEKRVEGLETRVEGLETRVEGLESLIGHLGNAVESLRSEMAERFRSVDERFETMDLRMDQFEHRLTSEFLTLREQVGRLEATSEFQAREISHLSAKVDDLKETMNIRFGHVEARFSRGDDRMARLESALLGVNTRVDGMAEDMRQRFRILTERPYRN
jgi:archaellum component FlaC